MRLWVALLFFGLMFCYFFIFARIRAETGLGMGVILWPKMLDEVVVTLVGAKYLRIPDLTVLVAMRWLYFGRDGLGDGVPVGGTQARRCGRAPGERVGTALGLLPRRGAARSCSPRLDASYLLCPRLRGDADRADHQHGRARRSTGRIGTWSTTNNGGERPDWGGIMAIVAGGLVTVGLSAAAVAFPLVPAPSGGLPGGQLLGDPDQLVLAVRRAGY